MPRKSRTPPPPPEEEPSGASREPDAEALLAQQESGTPARHGGADELEPFSAEWFAALEARAEHDPEGAATEFVSLRALDERQRGRVVSAGEEPPPELNTPEWFAELERIRVASGLGPFDAPVKAAQSTGDPTNHEPFTPEWFAAIEATDQATPQAPPPKRDPYQPTEAPHPGLDSDVLDGRVSLSDDQAASLNTHSAREVEQFSPEWFAQIERDDNVVVAGDVHSAMPSEEEIFATEQFAPVPVPNPDPISEQIVVSAPSEPTNAPSPQSTPTTPTAPRPPSVPTSAPPASSPAFVPPGSPTTPMRRVDAPHLAPVAFPQVAARAVRPIVAALVVARGAEETDLIESQLAEQQQGEVQRVVWEAEAWEIAASETIREVDMPRPYTSRDDAVWATVKRAAARETTTWETYSAAYRRLAEVRLAWETRARAFAATTVLPDARAAVHRAEAATSTAHRHAIVDAVAAAVREAGLSEALAWVDYDAQLSDVDAALVDARFTLDSFAEAELVALTEQLQAEQRQASRLAAATSLHEAVASELAAHQAVDQGVTDRFERRARAVADLDSVALGELEADLAEHGRLLAAATQVLVLATQAERGAAETYELADSERHVERQLRLADLVGDAQAELAQAAQQVAATRQSALDALMLAGPAEIEGIEALLNTLGRFEIARASRQAELETLALDQQRAAAERQAALRVEVVGVVSQRASAATTLEHASESQAQRQAVDRVQRLLELTDFATSETAALERSHQVGRIRPLVTTAGQAEEAHWAIYEQTEQQADTERTDWEQQARTFATAEFARIAGHEAQRETERAAQRSATVSLLIAEHAATTVANLAELDTLDAGAHQERDTWEHDAQVFAAHEFNQLTLRQNADIERQRARDGVLSAVRSAGQAEVGLQQSLDDMFDTDAGDRVTWEAQARDLAAAEALAAIARQADEAREHRETARAESAERVRRSGAAESVSTELIVGAIETELRERAAWEAQARALADSEEVEQLRIEAQRAAALELETMAATEIEAAPALTPIGHDRASIDPAVALAKTADTVRQLHAVTTRSVRELGAQEAQLKAEAQRREVAERDARDLAETERPVEIEVAPVEAAPVETPVVAAAAPASSTPTNPFDELSDAEHLVEEAQARLAKAREAARRRAEPLSVDTVGELPPEAVSGFDPSTMALQQAQRIAADHEATETARRNAEADAAAAAEARRTAELAAEAQHAATLEAQQLRQLARRSEVSARVRQRGGAAMRELFELEELLHDEDRDRTEWLGQATRVANDELIAARTAEAARQQALRADVVPAPMSQAPAVHDAGPPTLPAPPMAPPATPMPTPPMTQPPAYSPPIPPMAPAAATPQWGSPVPPVPPPPSMLRGPQTPGPLTGMPSRNQIPGRPGTNAPKVGHVQLHTYDAADLGRVSRVDFWGLIVLVVAALASITATLNLGLLIMQYTRIGAEVNKPQVTGGLVGIDRLVDTTSILLIVSTTVAGVFLIKTLYGASRNLAAFGRQDQQWAPFFAAIPAMWALVANEIWRGSDFRVRANDPAWPDGKGNPLVWPWLGSMLIAVVLIITVPLGPDTAGITPETLGAFRAALIPPILCSIAWIITSVLTLKLVHQVMRRQEQCRKAREQSIRAIQRTQNARTR